MDEDYDDYLEHLKELDDLAYEDEIFERLIDRNEGNMDKC